LWLLLVTGLLAGLPLFTNEGIFQGIPPHQISRGRNGCTAGIINM
jgi:hypothetical protein